MRRGDDGNEGTTGPSGTGAPGEVSYYVTAEEFAAGTTAEQAATVRAFVTANPVECQGTDPDQVDPLVKRVSAEASRAPRETDLTAILLGECGKR
jgi:hypothetical protein